jgi:hypothetical protein
MTQYPLTTVKYLLVNTSLKWTPRTMNSLRSDGAIFTENVSLSNVNTSLLWRGNTFFAVHYPIITSLMWIRYFDLFLFSVSCALRASMFYVWCNCCTCDVKNDIAAQAYFPIGMLIKSKKTNNSRRVLKKRICVIFEKSFN